MAFGAAQSMAVERRREVRRRVSFGSFIATSDASRFEQCRVHDFSPSGARVEMGEQAGLPVTVCFLDMRSRLAYEARIAWRKAPEMGLEFLKVYRFDEVPSLELRGMIEKACQ